MKRFQKRIIITVCIVLVFGLMSSLSFADGVILDAKETFEGENIISSTEKTSFVGSEIIIPSCEKPGYNLVGWSLSPELTEPIYLPGDRFSITDGCNFYAVWERTEEAVVFDASALESFSAERISDTEGFVIQLAVADESASGFLVKINDREFVISVLPDVENPEGFVFDPENLTLAVSDELIGEDAIVILSEISAEPEDGKETEEDESVEEFEGAEALFEPDPVAYMSISFITPKNYTIFNADGSYCVDQNHMYRLVNREDAKQDMQFAIRAFELKDDRDESDRVTANPKNFKIVINGEIKLVGIIPAKDEDHEDEIGFDYDYVSGYFTIPAEYLGEGWIACTVPENQWEYKQEVYELEYKQEIEKAAEQEADASKDEENKIVESVDKPADENQPAVSQYTGVNIGDSYTDPNFGITGTVVEQSVQETVDPISGIVTTTTTIVTVE